ncbi:histidine kinase [Aquimarina sp. 2201CG5-10]|uniref:sensor histidine kinase n=1 Tax=Aquimarina callyspongiae TaxID=3098150 RepID=UPI002AB3B752|nr:histidine kinase [Aquimarina sp. 2201CG5-10]MDY8136132.1 histidine kinase [Aquimarina sp. 2201CG5-10]
MKRISGKQYKLGIQLVFWSLFFLLFILSEYILNHQLKRSNLQATILGRLIFDAVIFFIHYKYLMPLFLPHRKYWLYFTSIAFVISLSVVGEIVSYQFYLKGEFFDISLGNRIFVEVVTTCILIISSGTMRFSSEWVDAKDKEALLEKDNLKLEGELKFLKSQINPHFLFNTLNSIYSLSHKKSPRAAHMVDKLSEIMRYLMYDGNQKSVPLSKEVKLIQDYIDLYGARFVEHHHIDFYHENVQSHHRIAPMLLIPFVENAFKHSNIFNKENAWVRFEMVVNNDTLYFTTMNTKTENPSEIISNNIGNQNVIKQLNYIYPDCYDINIEDNDRDYQLSLTIQL